mmetsp:Transcript_7770/g.21155  ORF Transcript_7770/g.21155 Transcript_7770/m.21155 type:complete len:205 (-) Transcript_7770:67-681(-)
MARAPAAADTLRGAGRLEAAEEAVQEQWRLLAEAKGEAHHVRSGVLANLRGRPWILLVWALEVVVILSLAIACVFEVWGSCQFELGIVMVCWYCYSDLLIVWGAAFAVVWSLSLYLAVLLTSRGFRMRAVPESIPRPAVHLFALLLAGMALLLCVGAALLHGSSACGSNRRVAYNHPRSGLLYGAALWSTCLAPPLLYFGRALL